MALSNTDLHPSTPPHPYITSITSTSPTTVPSLSHTGNVKNLPSCIICKASNTVVSGNTDSGLGVITVETCVNSRGSSFATARLIISLKPNIPTSSPSLTTSAAFRDPAITSPVSCRVVLGRTTVAGFPASKLRRVGEALPPNA